MLPGQTSANQMCIGRDNRSTISPDDDQENERTPKKTARGLNEPGTFVYLLDPMVVRDLGNILGLKPFQVVADLIQLNLFKSQDDSVDFATAAAVARKHGFKPERPPPGMLIL